MKYHRKWAVLSVLLASVSATADLPAEVPRPAPGLQIAWGKESGGWKLGVAVCQTKFTTGEPIMVLACTENAAAERRRAPVYATAQAGWNIDVVELDGSGAAPYTQLGRFIYGLDKSRPMRGNVQTRWVEPGETASDLIWINNLRDMTLSGRYSMTIGRQLQAPSGELVRVEAPPVEAQVEGYGPPPDALIQLLLLERQPVFAQQAAIDLGQYLGGTIQRMAGFAKEHADEESGKAARFQLEKLREAIDNLLKKKPEMVKEIMDATEAKIKKNEAKGAEKEGGGAAGTVEPKARETPQDP